MHEDSVKTRRVTPAHCSRLGAIEPLAFLGAWAEMEERPGLPHNARKMVPSQEQIDTWMRDCKDLVLAQLAADGVKPEKPSD